MTREEERQQAARDYHLNFPDCTFWQYVAFIHGAEWADEHPDIDVRTMAAWRGGYKEAIDKACKWLALQAQYVNIDAFRKAMKGE